jgi:hypothetical protein
MVWIQLYLIGCFPRKNNKEVVVGEKTGEPNYNYDVASPRNISLQ